MSFAAVEVRFRDKILKTFANFLLTGWHRHAVLLIGVEPVVRCPREEWPRKADGSIEMFTSS